MDSITVFSKCHHGWAYHPSPSPTSSTHISTSICSGAQIEAAHAIDVKTPVYLSAGLDEKEARRHPEWLIRDANDRMNWADNFLKPGYHQFCLNTPYLDILLAQIEEVVQNYDADGIFLDIVGVRTCVCHTCRKALLDAGEDPRDPAAVAALGERTYANYTRRANEAVHKHKPGLPVFHNNGHIRRGRRDLARMNTHLELESLPTGGWGYDHFPALRALCREFRNAVSGHDGQVSHDLGRVRRLQAPQRPALRSRAQSGDGRAHQCRRSTASRRA